MAKLRRFIITEPAFIAGSLLAPGSIVTSDDLGTYVDPVSKKDKPVRPPASSIEVDENGDALSAEEHDQLVSLLAGIAPAVQSPVAPFDPEARYRGQGAPAQSPGGPQFAAVDLPQPASPSRRGGQSKSDAQAEAAALAAVDANAAEINAAAEKAGAADAAGQAAAGG